MKTLSLIPRPLSLILSLLFSFYPFLISAEEHKHHDHKHEAHQHEEHKHHDHKHEEHKHEKEDAHDDHKHDGHAGHDDHKHDGHDDHDHAAELRSIELSDAAQSLLGITTARPEHRALESVVPVIGRLELRADAARLYALPARGEARLLVRELTPVKRGDALFTVRVPELVSRAAEIAALEARLKHLTQARTRNAELETTLAVKRGEWTSLVGGHARTNDTLTVRAESDGLVVKRLLDDGAWGDAGTPVLRVVDPAALQFRASVPVTQARALRDDLPVRIGGAPARLRIGLPDTPGLIPVTAFFDAPAANLRAGDRVTAEIVTDASAAPELCIPEAALLTDNLEPVVITRRHDTFTRVPVHPGRRANGFVAVEHLPPDSTLVLSGAHEILLALQSDTNSKPAHFHADGTIHEGPDHD